MNGFESPLCYSRLASGHWQRAGAKSSAWHPPAAVFTAPHGAGAETLWGRVLPLSCRRLGMCRGTNGEAEVEQGEGESQGLESPVGGICSLEPVLK